MSNKNVDEIIALGTTEVSRATTFARKAIEFEDKDHHEKAIIEYVKSMTVLYNLYCFFSGTFHDSKTTFTATPLANGNSEKSSFLAFNRPYLLEKINNKIIELYTRIVRIDNLISTGNVEINSLLRSVNIPLDLENDSNVNVVGEVLIKLEIDKEYDNFDNIIGHEFVKSKLKQLSHSFSGENMMIFQRRHISSSMMIILYGEPGTGKTSLVRALASHLDVPLYELKLASLYDKYVGESEKLMSHIFDWILMSLEPKIVFIDELDSLFGKRGVGNEESLDKKLKIIFMTEMNRFNNNTKIKTLIMGATNLITDIDEAIVRRSVLNIHVGKPLDGEEYEKILRHDVGKLKMNISDDVIQSIVGVAVRNKLSQSKIADIVKKLLSFVTAQINSEFHIEGFMDYYTYYSLNGNLLQPQDEKYRIISPPNVDCERVYLASERGRQLANCIILPVIDVDFWQMNKQALIEELPPSNEQMLS